MITPAPTLAWPRASAVTAAVISGASAASAATSPSHASENPARSPSRSSRETSSQLAARLTTTPAQNSTIPGIQTSSGIPSSNRKGADHSPPGFSCSGKLMLSATCACGRGSV